MNSVNLSVEPCGGTLVKTENGQGERYQSLKQLSKARGIAKNILSSLRQKEPLPHHGFQRDGTIKWEELQPYLSTYLATLAGDKTPVESGVMDTEREKLELRKLRAETIKLENCNKCRSRDYINRAEVLSTVTRLYSNVFNQLSRYLLYEAPSKCDGMNTVQLKAHHKEFLSRTLSVWKNQESLWAEAADISELEAEIDKP